jgi:hypothetical protein
MNPRLEVMLKDYEFTRNEAVYRLGARQTITTFFVPVVGGMIAAVYSIDDPVRALVLAIAVPLLCYETIYLWLSETQALRRASKYLHSLSINIQREVHEQDSRDMPQVLPWEQQLRLSIPSKERRPYYLRHFVLNTLLFWTPAFVFGAIGCSLLWQWNIAVGRLSAFLEILAYFVAMWAFKKKSSEIIELYSEKEPRNPDTV